MHLSTYLNRLKRELDVEEVIFGSRVSGIPLQHSDLDMIVVSRKFGGMPFLKRMELLSTMWDGEYRLEQFPYTPEELAKYKDKKVVIAEALSKGLKLRLK